MQDLDFSALSGSMVLISLVFILVIGSFFSLAVLRIFEHRKRSSIINFVAGFISFAIFVYVASIWSA